MKHLVFLNLHCTIILDKLQDILRKSDTISIHYMEGGMEKSGRSISVKIEKLAVKHKNADSSSIDFLLIFIVSLSGDIYMIFKLLHYTMRQRPKIQNRFAWFCMPPSHAMHI